MNISRHLIFLSLVVLFRQVRVAEARYIGFLWEGASPLSDSIVLLGGEYEPPASCFSISYQ